MDAIRVEAPQMDGCKAIAVDGVEYPVRDGSALVTGQHAQELREAGVSYLPSKSWSLSMINVDEMYCADCQRKTFAFFGPTCFCGGKRVPYDPETCPVKHA